MQCISVVAPYASSLQYFLSFSARWVSVEILNSRYFSRADIRLRADAKRETKIYSNPTRRHRGTLKDSGATLSTSRIRIIMSACLLHSVIRDFISSDKRINERRQISRAVARKRLQRKVTVGIHDGRSSFPRRFRSS